MIFNMKESFASFEEGAKEKLPEEEQAKKGGEKEMGERKTFETKEAARVEFKKEVDAILDARFTPEKGFLFHNKSHAHEVSQGTVAVLKIIQKWEEKYKVPEEKRIVRQGDIERGEAVGLTHDIKQEALREKGKMIARVRGLTDQDFQHVLKESPQLVPFVQEKGITKGNEAASVDEALEIMSRYYYRNANGSAAPLFDTSDPNFRKRVFDEIGTTYPKLYPDELPDEDIMALRIDQPYFTKESSAVGFSLGNADLREPLRKDIPEAFRESGIREWAELFYPQYVEKIKQGVESLSEEDQKAIASSILGWQKTQEGIGKWQKVLLIKHTEEFAEIFRGEGADAEEKQMAENIKADLFRYYEIRQGAFDRNIKAAGDFYRRLEAQYGDLRHEISMEKFKKLLEEVYLFGEKSILKE